jgi:hypothetical protein
MVDLLETLDSDWIAALVEYFEEYAEISWSRCSLKTPQHLTRTTNV